MRPDAEGETGEEGRGDGGQRQRDPVRPVASSPVCLTGGEAPVCLTGGEGIWEETEIEIRQRLGFSSFFWWVGLFWPSMDYICRVYIWGLIARACAPGEELARALVAGIPTFQSPIFTSVSFSFCFFEYFFGFASFFFLHTRA